MVPHKEQKRERKKRSFARWSFYGCCDFAGWGPRLGARCRIRLGAGARGSSCSGLGFHNKMFGLLCGLRTWGLKCCRSRKVAARAARRVLVHAQPIFQLISLSIISVSLAFYVSHASQIKDRRPPPGSSGLFTNSAGKEELSTDTVLYAPLLSLPAPFHIPASSKIQQSPYCWLMMTLDTRITTSNTTSWLWLTRLLLDASDMSRCCSTTS